MAMVNSLKSSEVASKANCYKKSCQLVPEKSDLLGYIIFKADSEEFLFSWRKTAFSNICDWVKTPSVAQIYDSADLAVRDVPSLPGADLMHLTVKRLYKVDAEFIVVSG